MLHPEKVETVLEVTKIEAVASSQNSTNRATRSTAPKKCDNGKSSRRLSAETKFHLEAPLAGSVKLAADFTDWEKAPLDLIKSQDGVWHTAVQLEPGEYAYRFIVDGQWYDDPQPALCVPNPFGTVNALVRVA